MIKLDPSPPSLPDRDLWPHSIGVRADGRLCLDACDLTALAAAHGTPLYVYDVATVQGAARTTRAALARGYPGPSLVCYAAKAYCAPWLLRVVAAEGLGLDVVSGGELHAASVASFPPDRIYLHGNNKTADELELALTAGIARVVVDNLEELAAVGRRAVEHGRRQPILLRIAPGIETQTHGHLQTGGMDTKFGFGMAHGQAAAAVAAALAHPGVELRGLHMHIGSQLTDVHSYAAAVDRLVAFAAEMRVAHGFQFRELSPGGGFGVRYTDADPPATPAALVTDVGRLVAATLHRYNLAARLPHLTIEPGRSLVAASAVALYRVGSVKRADSGRTYVAVDGGMADNARAATYGAHYTAVLANRCSDEPDTDVVIAGRYCESGDILVQNVRLPLPRPGDLIAIPMAGAYQLAMASNYNMVPRPAVIAVSNGRAHLVRRRETYTDVLAAELLDENLEASAR